MEQKLEKKQYAFWLCSLQGIGVKKRNRLLEYFGTPDNIFHSKRCQLEQVDGIKTNDIERIVSGRKMDQIRYSFERMEKKGIQFIFREEALFPERLKNIDDSPYGLFYKGKLPDESLPSVAVVGARRATEAGRSLADKFGYELAANGVQVISGMALGVDIASQKGALKYPLGHTFAVLGTGVDICYPAGHIESYMLMQENGGVISEFPLGTPALPYHFPMRNRLISGLSDGVLVIEAKKGSGSLITAEFGLEQGREIFVVPGGVYDSQYEGGNELLKNGAVFVTEIKDILDGLGILLDMDVIERKKKTNIMLETKEKMVYAILSLEPVHITVLMEHTGMEPQELLEVLVSLDRKKLIKTIGNNYFVLRI